MSTTVLPSSLAAQKTKLLAQVAGTASGAQKAIEAGNLDGGAWSDFQGRAAAWGDQVDSMTSGLAEAVEFLAPAIDTVTLTNLSDQGDSLARELASYQDQIKSGGIKLAVPRIDPNSASGLGQGGGGGSPSLAWLTSKPVLLGLAVVGGLLALTALRTTTRVATGGLVG